MNLIKSEPHEEVAIRKTEGVSIATKGKRPAAAKPKAGAKKSVKKAEPWVLQIKWVFDDIQDAHMAFKEAKHRGAKNIGVMRGGAIVTQPSFFSMISVDKRSRAKEARPLPSSSVKTTKKRAWSLNVDGKVQLVSDDILDIPLALKKAKHNGAKEIIIKSGDKIIGENSFASMVSVKKRKKKADRPALKHS